MRQSAPERGVRPARRPGLADARADRADARAVARFARSRADRRRRLQPGPVPRSDKGPDPVSAWARPSNASKTSPAASRPSSRPPSISRAGAGPPGRGAHLPLLRRSPRSRGGTCGPAPAAPAPPCACSRDRRHGFRRASEGPERHSARHLQGRPAPRRAAPGTGSHGRLHAARTRPSRRRRGARGPLKARPHRNRRPTLGRRARGSHRDPGERDTCP